ncbi:MAG: universal stress protein [Burkholderiaceae bacterium]
MQKIVVPCDGSENAVRAVRYAADLAGKIRDVQLHLLYVEDPVLMRQCAMLPPGEQEKFRCAEKDRILQEARDLLASSGVSFQEYIRTGPPADEIAHHVQEAGCDAVIMGTRGRSPLASVMIGSVATHTVHLVQVPVTLVK